MAGSWLKKSLLAEAPIQTTHVEAKLGTVIGTKGYTGEKNLGELGPLKEYYPEYGILRARSWQLFMESEIIQTIFGKYETYVIGKGIKLQSNPIKQILDANKIKIEIQKFNELAEARFSLFSKSLRSDYSNMSPLVHLQREAYKNSKIGGDLLVLLRVDDEDNVSVQLIDGDHIKSPRYGSETNPNVLPNGNRIINGVELDAKGQHVAYHVVQEDKTGRIFDTKRILARNPKNGMLMAYMVYGYKYRIDNVRGMPLMAVMFETIAKMERYKEAAVGGAEERQKIAFTIEHDLMAPGDNPFAATTVRAYDSDKGGGLIPETDDGTEVANKMAVTTNKQVINMPRGAKATMHEPGAEQSFGDFYKTNFNFIAAANRIPAEVALSMFNANYSASRASLNDWGETTINEQEYFGMAFLKPIYELYTHIAILKGEITAPDYVLAYFSKKYEITEALLNCRFLGPRIKHIDPLKEVKAEREKLGPLGAHIPLTTVEDVVESLGGGDSDANIEQFSEELTMAKDLGLKPIEPKTAKPGSANA